MRAVMVRRLAARLACWGFSPLEGIDPNMSLDSATVRRIAKLARIRVEEADVARLQGELNGILGWIEQLAEVDVEGVEPLTGGAQIALRLREDVVTDGGIPEQILSNAPDRVGAFFTVPKVVE
jgi:aspartyl-tRNA(Asn)/glutamyl-tRNA(Gln) amidotransferase subunit C